MFHSFALLLAKESSLAGIGLKNLFIITKEGEDAEGERRRARQKGIAQDEAKKDWDCEMRARSLLRPGDPFNLFRSSALVAIVCHGKPSHPPALKCKAMCASPQSASSHLI